MIFLLVFLLPVLITLLFGNIDKTEVKNINNTKLDFDNISLYYYDNYIKTPIKLDDYIISVVAAEMPALFEDEALKAQAVASRTYALKNIDISTDNDISKIGQEFITKQEMEKRWGDKFSTYYNKIKSNVLKTKNQIITYEDEPIEAVFHATSSGITENAKDVWNKDVPYLVSVDSTLDSESNNFIHETVYNKNSFVHMFSFLEKKLNPNNLLSQIKITKTSDTGNVIDVDINGEIISGADIRKLLGLRSTNFSIKDDGDNIIFVTKGYGHGVGMSQTGANLLAKQGYTYEEILKHYYTNVTIETK